ncbi:MAG: transcription termination/antitermination NusG family protein, partial [Terriglobales bacterium]
MAELRSGAVLVLESKLLTSSNYGIPDETYARTEKRRPPERWYAISVRPRHERVVIRHLAQRGLHYFLP